MLPVTKRKILLEFILVDWIIVRVTIEYEMFFELSGMIS